MPVQQHILNWLYSVLTSEYHDVTRTYNDVAQALSNYPSLSPRTDVHTFDNGVSALLLHLSGTIPVIFRGTTYRFPISLWVPHAYPREAPLVYVTPTENMMVRPGQHVDPQGQVYHPYLVGWSAFWDKSTILDFLAILRDVFAKEPPVIARQQPPPTAQPPPPGQGQTPPPVPPLPPDLAPRPASHAEAPGQQARPPPPPPKTSVRGPSGGPPTSQPWANSTPPSLPLASGRPVGPYASGTPQPSGPLSQPGSRYDSAPPLPPPQHPQHQQPPGPAFVHRPADPRQAPPLPEHYSGSQGSGGGGGGGPHRIAMVSPPQQYGGPPPGWHPPPVQQQPKPRPAPPPDILDEPLTLSIPSPSNLPAPPIPPNPEKDALLHQLAQTLYSLRQRSRQQNQSSMAGLQAQRTAMLSAYSTLQSEMGAVSQTSALLNSNGGILHDALRKADSAIEGSRRHPAPDIDDLLVAPTVVANQLYSLVAEERAIGDTIFVLGRAVERGRISPAVFAKTTRSLAREWYLKKALVRKIGRGMGLAA